jgi:hypothetical protein
VLDVILIIAAIGFLSLGWGYVRFCETVTREERDT